MAANYSFALDLDLNPTTIKTVGVRPYSIFQFQATDGARWIATADQLSNRVSLFQIAGVDGIVDDQATITSNALITKPVGIRPYSIFQFQATDGARWIATADYNSNSVSLFQIAGVDGIVDDQATITSNALITKTVGTGPISVFQFQATDGARWIATADDGSARVSLFQIAGVDGIVDDQATITSNALIIKTVGINPYSVFQFQATDGARWIATADEVSNRVSLFQIAGVDGIVDDQATITSNALITKTVGSNPYSVFQFQAADGTRWIATADSGSARVSLFQIAGVDGTQLLPNAVTDVAVSLSTKLITAANLAEVTSSLDYFNFAAGMTSFAISFPFVSFPYAYTFDFDDSGTIGSGSALRLTTATADITNSAGITVASGATVRLGKKATYTIDFFFQNGSTLEVFPNSDRSGDDLDLTNCTFAATTTINVTSGTATVLVLSTTGITTGTGVTLSTPAASYTAASLDDGTGLYLAHQQAFVVASSAVNTGPNTITLGNDSNSQPPAFATGSPYTNVKIQASAGAVLPTTSPQIVDGGRYYATISSGAITLFIKEADISATPITISTTGTNASGSIFTLIAETELSNTTISGGSGASVPLTLASGDRVIRKAIYWDDPGGIATATPLYIQEFLWSATAGINDPLVVDTAIELNQVHEDIVASTSVQLGGRIKDASGTVVTELPAANDGSTLDASNGGPNSFALEGGGGKLQVNASDADGLILWQDIYIWGVWVSSTPAGIRLINADTSSAIRANTFVFANFEIDNISSTRLNIVGGNATSVDGSSLVAPIQTGSGGINPNALSLGTLLVFETGISGLTAGEAGDLADLAATLQTAGVFSTAALANSGGGLTAQQVRDAVGLGSANLDTQLGAIDTVVDAILVDTDATIPAQITDRTLAAANYFDPATDTVANVTTVSTVTDKTGYSLTTPPLDSTATQAAAAAALTAYDPPTRAELTSDIGTVTGAIDGLNDLSAAQVNAEVDTALADYDGPTKAELDSAVAGLATSAALATVDGVVDAILEDTATTIPALIADVPTVAEFEARTIPAADYFVVSDYTAPANADIAAIKAKTDNLPSDPADQSAVEAAITAAQSAILAGGFTSGDRNILIAAEAAARAVASGRHKIDYAASTATQYNADGSVRTVFDLVDADGNPATTGATAVERVPQ